MESPVKVQEGLGLAAALAGAAGLWIVGRYFIAPGVDVDAMARGVVGPATWPRTMLYCAAACAAAAFLRMLAGILMGRREPAQSDEPAPQYHELRSLAAVAVLVAYGAALPIVGIAWATAAFLAGWLLLGGVRKPLVVSLVAVLGTAAILYVFVNVSLMPLDRGKGVFEQATVALYHALGIY